MRLDRGLALRGWFTRKFLLKVKRATHRAPAQLIDPKAERVLVIAPHMDDEVIGCGGTLLRLREEDRTRIHVVFASNSSAGLTDPVVAAELMRVRRAEAARVSSYMGFDSTIELGFPDGALVDHELELRDKFREQIDRIDPQIIFCPFPADSHSDHMSCAWALARATETSAWKGKIFAYEVWSPLWPNGIVDITGSAERKLEAIRFYESQLSDRDYGAATLGLNRYRGLPHSLGYAEAFHICTPTRFVGLTNLLDEIIMD